MRELAMEIGEGNIAEKVKKENKIKIKERPHSLFYTTFQREECRRKSKPSREKEHQKKGKKKKQQKKRKKKELLIELFPLYSPEFPLRLG